MDFFQWLKLREEVSSTEAMLNTLLSNPDERVPGSNIRLILADSMDEDNRHNEAKVLRSDKKIGIEKYPTGIIRLYVYVDGVNYHASADPLAIEALDYARKNRIRIMVSYGNTSGDKAGHDWLEEHNNTGIVGITYSRNLPRPILINNSRSFYGKMLLDDSIVRIVRTTGGSRFLYEHPQYSHGKIEIKAKKEPYFLGSGKWLTHDVDRDGKTHASFGSELQAKRWINKMGLKVHDPEKSQD